ncbi:MAG: hypothetical protein FWD66_08500 [Paludibacter sp.]|nr:hypothetical protein [Paludibacter sp.]
MKDFKVIFGIFIVLVLYFAFFTSNNITAHKKIDNQKDTIKSNTIDICNLSDKYFNFGGIVISDYYVVSDSLYIDLNRDNLTDCLLVLTPKPLLPEFNNCFSDDVNYCRILVEIINDNGRYRIRNTYDNLIDNIGGVLSEYNGMYKTKNGFKIIHEAGAKFSYEYTMFFDVKQNGVYLSKITKGCNYDGIDSIETYRYLDRSPKLININDTINQNCNCDNIWDKFQTMSDDR